ncbi:MAG: type II toxin-antitoxin system PemK/MazF family toxin, partial [Mycobacteriaceae bacterium]
RRLLVVGREGADIPLGLTLSSQSMQEGQREWMALGIGEWDSERRPSWVRMDRVLDVPEEGIRREGAIMDLDRFDRVAARLRDEHGWD